MRFQFRKVPGTSLYLIEKVKTLTLTMEEIINLEKSTKYKEDEIKEWFRFVKQKYLLLEDFLCVIRIFKTECPNCQMKKEKVIDFYKMIMPNENAESFVEQIFQNFDCDNNGYLDFQVLSLHNLLSLQISFRNF